MRQTDGNFKSGFSGLWIPAVEGIGFGEKLFFQRNGLCRKVPFPDLPSFSPLIRDMAYGQFRAYRSEVIIKLVGNGDNAPKGFKDRVAGVTNQNLEYTYRLEQG